MTAQIGDWIAFTTGGTQPSYGAVEAIGQGCYGVWSNGQFLRVEAGQVREVRRIPEVVDDTPAPPARRNRRTP